MQIFGFKPARFRQWIRVIELEGRHLPLRDKAALALKLVAAALGIGSIDRRTWRARMRVCGRCPLHDRELKRCRPYSGSPLGCGCFTPFKALAPGPCWGKEHLPPSERIGWE